MTGLVGMTGGVGGFYLASSLGYSKQFTGSYQFGLLLFAILAMVALIGLTSIKKRWRTTWGIRRSAMRGSAPPSRATTTTRYASVRRPLRIVSAYRERLPASACGRTRATKSHRPERVWRCKEIRPAGTAGHVAPVNLTRRRVRCARAARQRK